MATNTFESDQGCQTAVIQSNMTPNCHRLPCKLISRSDCGDSWTIVCAAFSPRMRLNNNANIASPSSILSSGLSIIVSTSSSTRSDLRLEPLYQSVLFDLHVASGSVSHPHHHECGASLAVVLPMPPAKVSGSCQ